jgi:hypothetical protein
MKIQGTIKVKAVLTNPPGLFEEDVPLDLPAREAIPAALAQYAGTLQFGLLRFVDATEIEVIPIQRVANVSLKFEEQNVQIAAPGTEGKLARTLQKIVS